MPLGTGRLGWGWGKRLIPTAVEGLMSGNRRSEQEKGDTDVGVCIIYCPVLCVPTNSDLGWLAGELRVVRQRVESMDVPRIPSGPI